MKIKGLGSSERCSYIKIAGLTFNLKFLHFNIKEAKFPLHGGILAVHSQT